MKLRELDAVLASAPTAGAGAAAAHRHESDSSRGDNRANVLRAATTAHNDWPALQA